MSDQDPRPQIKKTAAGRRRIAPPSVVEQAVGGATINAELINEALRGARLFAFESQPVSSFEKLQLYEAITHSVGGPTTDEARTDVITGLLGPPGEHLAEVRRLLRSGDTDE